jgi:hypothetical protein
VTLTGGCQCGAVRYRVEGALGRASICHCRMCQKAFGGPFGALVSARRADLAWTRGERSVFASSNKVQRGFCAACGTPLTFEYAGDWIDLAIFTLDARRSPRRPSSCRRTPARAGSTTSPTCRSAI